MDGPSEDQIDRGLLFVEVHSGQHVKDGYSDHFLVLTPQRPVARCAFLDDKQIAINEKGKQQETPSASEGGTHPVWEPVKKMVLELDSRCHFLQLQLYNKTFASCDVLGTCTFELDELLEEKDSMVGPQLDRLSLYKLDTSGQLACTVGWEPDAKAADVHENQSSNVETATAQATPETSMTIGSTQSDEAATTRTKISRRRARVKSQHLDVHSIMQAINACKSALEMRKLLFEWAADPSDTVANKFHSHIPENLIGDICDGAGTSSGGGSVGDMIGTDCSNGSGSSNSSDSDASLRLVRRHTSNAALGREGDKTKATGAEQSTTAKGGANTGGAAAAGKHARPVPLQTSGWRVLNLAASETGQLLAQVGPGEMLSFTLHLEGYMADVKVGLGLCQAVSEQITTITTQITTITTTDSATTKDTLAIKSVAATVAAAADDIADPNSDDGAASADADTGAADSTTNSNTTVDAANLATTTTKVTTITNSSSNCNSSSSSSKDGDGASNETIAPSTTTTTVEQTEQNTETRQLKLVPLKWNGIRCAINGGSPVSVSVVRGKDRCTNADDDDISESENEWEFDGEESQEEVGVNYKSTEAGTSTQQNQEQERDQAQKRAIKQKRQEGKGSYGSIPRSCDNEQTTLQTGQLLTGTWTNNESENCVVCVRLDNSYSRLRGKTLRYQLRVVNMLETVHSALFALPTISNPVKWGTVSSAPTFPVAASAAATADVGGSQQVSSTTSTTVPEAEQEAPKEAEETTKSPPARAIATAEAVAAAAAVAIAAGSVAVTAAAAAAMSAKQGMDFLAVKVNSQLRLEAMTERQGRQQAQEQRNAKIKQEQEEQEEQKKNKVKEEEESEKPEKGITEQHSKDPKNINLTKIEWNESWDRAGNQGDDDQGHSDISADENDENGSPAKAGADLDGQVTGAQASPSAPGTSSSSDTLRRISGYIFSSAVPALQIELAPPSDAAPATTKS